LAGAFTTAALAPQAIKSWKTKHTKDVSLGWIIILTIGVFLWIIYGILLEALPVIVANSVTFVLAVIVLVLKIKYK
jgi:MtN3 and saliva related transmembrane protein